MDDKHIEEFGKLLEAHQAAQERGDVDGAQAAALECLAFVADHPLERDEGMRVVEEAREHEAAGRWELAEAAHRRAVAIAEVTHNAANVYKAHDDLSNLFHLRGMPEQALAEAKLALEAARGTGIEILVAVAQESLANDYLIAGDTAAAATLAEEMVAALPDERMYDLRRARALIVRARCRAASGDADSAERDLELPWRILAPQSQALFMAGVQSALASWWETTARIRALREDHAGVAQALSHAVGFRRTVASLPQLDGVYKHRGLASALKRYATALAAAGKLNEAEQANTEADDIERSLGARSA